MQRSRDKRHYKLVQYSLHYNVPLLSTDLQVQSLKSNSTTSNLQQQYVPRDTDKNTIIQIK